ncbi:hypothetical protein GPECTOR_114g303 [Gonium pectorale]|uniref:Ataxin-10 domain-containing protein n=1 Tax=Gonium pectorale TaxID=33097 RepID=A0A150FZ22_GONPE|nr:hypothetical protein GPECTOR_114g303 [Gonium pectorale]|eukprot:KXZ42852.1 hypothetical protein GPECTOR_114g303 [Gonium pectorale]
MLGSSVVDIGAEAGVDEERGAAEGVTASVLSAAVSPPIDGAAARLEPRPTAATPEVATSGFAASAACEGASGPGALASQRLCCEASAGAAARGVADSCAAAGTAAGAQAADAVSLAALQLRHWEVRALPLAARPLAAALLSVADLAAAEAQRLAGSSAGAACADAALPAAVLEAALELLKALAQREDGGRAVAAGHDMAEGDLVSVLANGAFRRRRVALALLGSGGLELLLAQTNLDDHSPLAREWALWGVRNMCEGNEEVQRRIAGLELQTSVQTPELQKLGLRLDLDKATGKLKVSKTEESAAAAAARRPNPS